MELNASKRENIRFSSPNQLIQLDQHFVAATTVCPEREENSTHFSVQALHCYRDMVRAPKVV